MHSIAATATVAWSPNSAKIATGTATGALDASFSTSSQLAVYSVDDCANPIQSVDVPARFARLSWSIPASHNQHGIIAGGLDNGHMMLWNAEDLSVLHTSTDHTGAVQGLSFNPSQHHILASGAANGDIKIWDCSKPESPTAHAPANARSQRLDHIRHLDWNRQVAHIVATASNSGWCVVWDLRNKREVMQLGNLARGASIAGPMSAVAWNPTVATQLYTASEDDNAPAVLCWDLRNAHAPDHILSNGHTKGILSMTWSDQDPALLITSGKDHRTLLWDLSVSNAPTFAETSTPRTHWVYDVAFAKHDPSIISAAGFDGRVEISRLRFGGWAHSDDIMHASQQNVVRNEDPFGLTTGHVESEVITSGGEDAGIMVKTPPKWMRPPCIARFGFGGRLFTCINDVHATAMKSQPAQHGVQGMQQVLREPRIVSVRTVVTEPEFVNAAVSFKSFCDQASATDSDVSWNSICSTRLNEANNDEDKTTWDILGILFESDARDRLVKKMGIERDQVAQELQTKVFSDQAEDKTVNGLSESTSAESTDADFFAAASPVNSKETDSSAPFTINTVFGEDKLAIANGVITKSILLGDFETAVQAALAVDRLDDALILAMCGGRRLLSKTRATYFSRKLASTDVTAPYLRLLRDVSSNDLLAIVREADLADWRNILVVLCTYAKGEDFGGLCRQLAERIEKSSNADSRQDAIVCYLAAGDVERAVNIWEKIYEERLQNLISSTLEGETNPTESFLKLNCLQSFIEKITILRAAVEFVDPAVSSNESSSFVLASLYRKYKEYAEFLVDQGQLQLATSYMALIPTDFGSDSDSSNLDIAAFRYRLVGRGEQLRFPWIKYFVGRDGETGVKVEATADVMGRKQRVSSNVGHMYNTEATGYGNIGTTVATYPTTTNVYTQQSQLNAPTTYATYGATPTAAYNNIQPEAVNYSPYGNHSNYPPTQASTNPPMPAPTTFGGYAPGPTFAPTSNIPAGSTELPASMRTDIPGWNDVPEDLVKPKKPLVPAAVPPPMPSNTYAPQPSVVSSSHAQPPIPPPHGNYGQPSNYGYQPAPQQGGYPTATYGMPAAATAGNPYGYTAGSPPQPSAPLPITGMNTAPYGQQPGYPKVVNPSTAAKVEKPVSQPKKTRHRKFNFLVQGVTFLATGDRLHVPAEQLPILTSFDREFTNLRAVLPV